MFAVITTLNERESASSHSHSVVGVEIGFNTQQENKERYSELLGRPYKLVETPAKGTHCQQPVNVVSPVR